MNLKKEWVDNVEVKPEPKKGRAQAPPRPAPIGASVAN